MEPSIGSQTDRAATRLSLINGRENGAPERLRSADQTLELCLLDTQRQVHRLEEIVHRLTSVAQTGAQPPAGVMSMIHASNRRLQREVDEFSADSHAVMNIVRPVPVPIARSAES